MRFVHLFAKPCTCKGYIGRLLKERYEDAIEVIGTGDLVRKALGDDGDFRKKYGSKVKGRYLVPDIVVYRLLQERLEQIRNQESVVVLDGLGRKACQVKWAVKAGLLKQGESIALVFNAKNAVCKMNYHDRRLRQPDGQRSDDEEYLDFCNGLEIFRNNWGTVWAALLRINMRVCQIDANRDIKTEVFPDVVAQIETLMPRLVAPESKAIDLICRQPIPGLDSRARLSLQPPRA